MQDKPYMMGIEIHDVSLWEPTRVFKVIESMKLRGYNALVLHQNDLLDICTQLGLTANFGVSDLRLKKVKNKLAWMAKLIEKLDTFGAKLYLEIKEPSYDDYILEFFPELIDDKGHVDPTHPSWQKICRQKTEFLLDALPGIGGFIVNISSPESRVSLQDYLAANNRNIDMDGWFDLMIGAFHEPLQARGKDLYIRDFAYTEGMQGHVLKAIERCEGSVSACIKITPHDYFPEFANNEAARTVNAPKIIEFEAFGEHMGWGLIPNCRVAEFAQRMQFVRDIGAEGFIVRISWEAISGPHALDCLSDVNVFALSKLAHKDEKPEEIITAWLAEKFTMEPQGELAKKVASLLLESWEIIAAAYWDGDVFPRHSCLPVSWQEGWHSILTKGMGARSREHDLDDKDNPLLSDTEKEKLFARKENAVVLADKLYKELQEIASDLPPALSAMMMDSFALLPLYARKFELATKGTFWAARDRDANAEELKKIQKALSDVANQAETIINERPDAPHSLSVLFSPSHIRKFSASLDEAA